MSDNQIKCSSCGGMLNIKKGAKTVICPFCQTPYLIDNQSKKKSLAITGRIKSWKKYIKENPNIGKKLKFVYVSHYIYAGLIFIFGFYGGMTEPSVGNVWLVIYSAIILAFAFVFNLFKHWIPIVVYFLIGTVFNIICLWSGPTNLGTDSFESGALLDVILGTGLRILALVFAFYAQAQWSKHRSNMQYGGYEK